MSDTPSAPADSKPKNTFVDSIVTLATQGITPTKVAFTIAVGTAIALFPILGTTTLLCILVGVLLRLNQPLILLLNGAMTPLHLPVIFGFLKLGAMLFGSPYAHVGIRMMNHMFWDDPHEFWLRFGSAAYHAVIAWAIVTPFWVALVYCIALPVCREIARRAVKLPVLEAAEPPDHPIP